MLKASNPTEKPTELRAACGCRFTPRSLVPEADEGVLVLTSICVSHSQQRTKRLMEKELSKNKLESVADAGYCQGCGFFDHGDAPCDLPPERPCKRVFSGYNSVAVAQFKCDSHGGVWREAEKGCPKKDKVT